MVATLTVQQCSDAANKLARSSLEYSRLRALLLQHHGHSSEAAAQWSDFGQAVDAQLSDGNRDLMLGESIIGSDQYDLDKLGAAL